MTKRKLGRFGSVSPVDPSDGYIAFFPCNQANPDTTTNDTSGKGNNATHGASLIVPWVNAGYLTTATGTSTRANMANNAMDVWDYSAGDSLLVHFRIKVGSIPGATTPIMGNGLDSTVNFGIQFRIQSTGTVQVGYYNSSGSTVFAGSTSVLSTTVFHTISLAVDGNTKRGYIYFNNAIESNGHNIGTVNLTAPTNDWWLGGSTNTSGHDCIFSDIHILSKDGGLPSNISDIVRRLNTTRYQALTNREWPQ